MDFEKKRLKLEKIGKITGFILMFIIFSIILYYILKLTGKLPLTWRYFDIILVTFGIVIIGKFLREILEK